MKKFFFTISFILSCLFCFAQTQSEMNRDADLAFNKADKELNLVYKKILKDYSQDKLFIKNFKNAQRIWIQFRDAEMLAKYPLTNTNEYGSAHPMCWAMYLTELTNERITKLKVWANGNEEGDICNGSLNVK